MVAVLGPSLRGVKRRSNPFFSVQRLDCFASLAMTGLISLAAFRVRLRLFPFLMPGFVPGIHGFFVWQTGHPATTNVNWLRAWRGQFVETVQCDLPPCPARICKNILISFRHQITCICSAVSSHMRGVSRSSRTRGGMRWTRAALLTRALISRTAKSCGPDASTLASSLAEDNSAGDGDKQARSPGRARNKP